MEAATLNCPMCGAPAASDATRCEHCGARLATVACPSCFAMIFLGSKFCQHCGAKIERVEEIDAKPKQCPHCKSDLTALALGAEHVHECPQCEGLWVDVDTFNAICADREKQAAVILNTPPESPDTAPKFSLDGVHYVPCPACGKLMNRVNFAHGSGIILDICKADGVWFEKDQLRRIVEFIRAGGLEKSREMDREIWEEEKSRAAFRSSLPSAGIGSADTGLDIPPSTASAAADFIGFAGRVILNLLR